VPLAVCATPIGNLEDVTLRLLRELREADVVLCEDTRQTRKLLERHGLSARLQSYHEHNEAERTAEVLPRLQAGERFALVTDAGMPAISDPGARLVAAALEAGVPVTVVPGPSAVETALVASGFGTDRFQFLGSLAISRALKVSAARSGRSSPGGRMRRSRSSRRSGWRARSRASPRRCPAGRPPSAAS
jgi:16S rRNA (cytidine1402-2'-O)-methyltransferase